MANKLGYRLVGKVTNCDACALVKAISKRIIRSTKDKTTIVGERMGLDFSGPFPLTSVISHKSIEQNLYWYELSDFYSTKMISTFRRTKSELVEFVDEAYNIMKNHGTPITIIRMDNTGENQAIKKKCQENII